MCRHEVLNFSAPAAAVYKVGSFSGEPTESEEMKPIWFDGQEVPYAKMWADDIYWYPLFLKGCKFQGLFAFQNTHDLVWHQLLEVEELNVPATDLLLQLAQKTSSSNATSQST